MTRGRASYIGDTRVSPNGYHYTRTEAGWELTHRVVAERSLGRKLFQNERIRFRDGNRRNIDPANIEVYLAKASSTRKKIASLEAKKAEIEAQLVELYSQL